MRPPSLRLLANTARYLSLVLAVLGGSSCAEVLGPAERVAPPTLQSISVDAANLQAGGTLTVDASPTDTTFRLEDAGLSVEVTTTSGDEERPLLGRRNCPWRDRGWHYLCHQYFIEMAPGNTLNQVKNRIEASGGRIAVSFNALPSAYITLFSADDVAEKVHDARDWPGVSTVSLAQDICQAGIKCFFLSDLEVPLPVDTGTARQHDGTLQVRAGDTITVWYQQPDGSSLVTRVVFP